MYAVLGYTLKERGVWPLPLLFPFLKTGLYLCGDIHHVNEETTLGMTKQQDGRSLYP